MKRFFANHHCSHFCKGEGLSHPFKSRQQQDADGRAAELDEEQQSEYVCDSPVAQRKNSKRRYGMYIGQKTPSPVKGSDEVEDMDEDKGAGMGEVDGAAHQ